jgi:hypothetical protein
MSAVQKRLSIVGITVALILLASVSLYGQDSPYADRFVFSVSSEGYLNLFTAAESASWTVSTFLGQQIPTSSPMAATVINSNNEVEVFWISANQVYSIYGGPLYGWVGRCVTCAAGAPEAATGSALTGFEASGYTHVFYEDTNGDVNELYCLCSNTSGTWIHDNPTSLAGGAPVAASGSALTSFIYTGVMHVFYLGTNNNVYELYWDGGTAWHHDDPTSLAGAPVAISGSALTSFDDGSGVMHVFYLNSENYQELNVQELYWNGGTAWHTDNATSQAGVPLASLAAVGSALTGFVNTSGIGDTGMHVMYLATNGEVYALHAMSSPAWSYFDATTSSGGVAAVGGSALASFQDTVTGGVRLYFLDIDNHLYELYWPTEGAATETDLTVASGSTGTQARGSALAAVMTPN